MISVNVVTADGQTIHCDVEDRRSTDCIPGRLTAKGNLLNLGDCPSAPLRTRGLRSLGRSRNPLTEEEDGSGACSAKKGSESAISPSRFAVQGAPLVFQMLGTQRRILGEEVELPAVGKYAELGFTIAVTNAADATPGDRVSSSQEKSFKFNRFVAKRIPLNTQVPDEFLSPGW